MTAEARSNAALYSAQDGDYIAACLARLTAARYNDLRDLTSEQFLLRAYLNVVGGGHVELVSLRLRRTRAALRHLEEFGVVVETSEGWGPTEEHGTEEQAITAYNLAIPPAGFSRPVKTSARVETRSTKTKTTKKESKTMATTATKTAAKRGAKRTSAKTSTGKGKATSAAKPASEKATPRKRNEFTTAQLNTVRQMRESGEGWKAVCEALGVNSAIPIRKALVQADADNLQKITGSGASLAKKVAAERKKDTGFYILAARTGKTETQLKELLTEHGYEDLVGRVYFKNPEKAKAAAERKAKAAESKKAATGGKPSGRKGRGRKAATPTEDPSDEA